MKNLKIKRRSILKALGIGGAWLGSNPLGLLMQASLNKAYAEITDTTNEKIFVALHFNGGPCRWMYDNPLTPGGQVDHHIHNPMIITKFNESNLRGEYKVQKIGNYHLPIFWNGTIPTPTGSANINEILNHFLMIRGLRMPSDGHIINLRKMFQPVEGVPTTNGLLADKSQLPIQAIGYDTANLPFSSAKGIGFLNLKGDDPYTDLLAPFTLNDNISMANNELEELFDQTLNRMMEDIDPREVKKRNTFKDRLNAKRIFKRNFSNLRVQYNTIKEKYSQLITSSLIDPQYSLGEGIDRRNFLNVGLLENISPDHYNIQNLNIVRGQSHSLPNGINLINTLDNQVFINSLAGSFAVAEFIIRENLSNNLALTINGLNNISILGQRKFFNFDSHNCGAISSLFYYLKTWQGFHACLHEFVSFLKRQNVFERSVIALSTDMGRKGRINGSGSDHGWQGSSYSIISGMVRENMIIGNIMPDQNPTYKGSWGLAAPMAELNNRPIGLGNVISTLSSFLDIESPTSNNAPLAWVSQGIAQTSLGASNEE